MASETNQNNGRWWEYYLVRYFIGTVVGTLIIIFLSSQKNSFFSNILFDTRLIVIKESGIEIGNLVLFGFIGLTFCYLASAPVLLLHAVRSLFTSAGEDRVNSKKWFASLGSMAGLIFITIIFTFIKTIIDSNLNFNFGFLVILIISVLQLALIIVQMFRKNIFTFYKELVFKRAVESKEVKQYTESYKHLREHGNAFLIVFFEIILGIIYASINSTSSVTSIQLAVIYTILWIMPACCVWAIGTYLEMKIRTPS